MVNFFVRLIFCIFFHKLFSCPKPYVEYMCDQGLMDTSLFSSNKRLRLVFRLNNDVWLKTALNQEYWQIEGRSVPAVDVAQLHVV